MIKFLFDRIVSFCGILLLWPFFLIIVLLIRLKMPGGPVFFTQKRVGKDSKLFKMYKFRSMTINHGGSSVSVAGEARITTLGAFLRKYKLDELPELWNVFVGDMSFVGPRPDVPGYADKLVGEDRLILNLRPGITGPASLKYRDEENLIACFVRSARDSQKQAEIYNVDFSKMSDEEIAVWYNDYIIYPDKVKINLDYYRHNNLWCDLKYILLTVLG